MIRLPSFAYIAPTTVDEAVRAIADAGPDGMLVAGGTDRTRLSGPRSDRAGNPL